MATHWKAIRVGFLDGLTAFIVMFGDIRIPDSPAEKLIRLTAPEALAEYRAINPDLPDAIVKLRDEAILHDRQYAMLTRIVGGIELALALLAVCYMALHRR
jgi:hypothetical protein